MTAAPEPKAPVDAHTLEAPPLRDSAAVVLLYLVAIVVGVVAASAVETRGAYAVELTLLVGTCAATVPVWLASMALRNDSLYDAYWSVAPFAMGCALVVTAARTGTLDARLLAAMAVLSLWSWRLTWNWYRSWGGLGHEDWRYGRIRERSGVFYPLVSLLGIQLMPTLMTWAGTLPLVPIHRGGGDFGLLDVVALLLGLGAVALEARADTELHAFRRTRRDATQVLDSGLWARCRHPNYLGEMLFWWSLALFAVARDPAAWPWSVGALAITALFLGVSIPLIETRLAERKPAHAAYRARVPLLLPLGRPAERD